MEREFKFKAPGIIFYLFLILMLVLTRTTIDLIKDFEPDDIDIIFSVLIPLGVIFFTSEGIGYLFSTIVYFFYNHCFGGYKKLFHSKLSYNKYHRKIIELYENSNEPTGPLDPFDFNNQLSQYSDEALLMYFFWYRDKHENKLDGWHLRRYSAFFTNWTSLIAIVIAQLIAWILIAVIDLKCSCANTIVSIISFFMIIMLYKNSRKAKKDAIQALDLWVAGATNPRFKSVLDEIHPMNEVNREKTDKSNKGTPLEK